MGLHSAKTQPQGILSGSDSAVIVGVLRDIVQHPNQLVVSVTTQKSSDVLSVVLNRNDYAFLTEHSGRALRSLNVVAVALSKRSGRTLALEVKPLDS